MITRVLVVTAFVVLLTAGYVTAHGRITAVCVIAAAVLIALVRYGHEATTLYLDERHRKVLKGQS